MIKFTKDDKIKLIDENSKLIPRLEDDGWKREAKKPVKAPKKVKVAAKKD